jgi:hypothetical protein
VENGVVPPSDVFSNSDEAFLLVTLEGNHVQWRGKAELLRMAQRKLLKQKRILCQNKSTQPVETSWKAGMI